MAPALSVPQSRTDPEIYLYRRIEEALRQMIRRDNLGPGARLPSEATLAREFATTRVTVGKALAALEHEGLVRRLVGRGTFVAEPPSVTSFIDTRTADSFEEQVGGKKVIAYRLISFARAAAPPLASKHLQETETYRLQRLRLLDGRILGLEDRYVPPVLARRITGPMLAERSAVEIVEELLGFAPTIEVSLFPAIVDPQVARLLEVSEGSPVTVREHVFRAPERAAILCGQNVFSAAVRLAYVLGGSS